MLSGAYAFRVEGLRGEGTNVTLKDGNVGIGTTEPNAQLEVVGDVRANGAVHARTFTGDGSGLENVVKFPGTMVRTGYITNGQVIPLPDGFEPSECTWSVSNATNHRYGLPELFAGNRTSVDENRVVTCGFWDNGRLQVGGSCSYVIACNR